jgi:chromosome condensin MukBEF MukE localization factor
MKIIQTFEQNALATINIQEHQKNSFFYDKDNKVTLVSLSVFEKLCLFLQKIFCCRSGSKLKIKEFTKISDAELKTIIQRAQITPVIQATPQESTTFEIAQEYLKKGLKAVEVASMLSKLWLVYVAFTS